MSEDLRDLEHETERSRDNVSGLLDELRARVSPGEMVDQIVGYAGDGAGEMVRNLGSQLRNNPLPALMVGVGVAWLMLGERKPGVAASSGPGLGSEVRNKLRKVFGSVQGAAGTAAAEVRQTRDLVATRASDYGMAAAEGAQDVGQRLGDSLHEAGDQARTVAGNALSNASVAYESAAETAQGAAERARLLAHDASAAGQRAARAAAEQARHFAENAGAAGQRAVDAARHAGESASEFGERAVNNAAAFLKEQPLVAAGLGLAVGAVIGALLPATAAENKLMGETSDALKERARAAAQEQYDGAKSAIREAADEAYGTVVGTVASEEESRDNLEPTPGEDTTQLHASR